MQFNNFPLLYNQPFYSPSWNQIQNFGWPFNQMIYYSSFPIVPQTQLSHQFEPLSVQIQDPSPQLINTNSNFLASKPQNVSIQTEINIKNEPVLEEKIPYNIATPTQIKIEQKETKNIPKNFAKAMLTYIEKNPKIISNFFSSQKEVESFLKFIHKKKNLINSIKMFQAITSTKGRTKKMKKYNQIIRSMGFLMFTFLRKNMVNYVFNSKIKQQLWHLKYRRFMTKVLTNPDSFTSMNQDG